MTTVTRTSRPLVHDDALAELSRRVRAKRDDVDAYVATVSTRRDRLMYVTVVCGSVATALTASPALGGETFTAWLTATLQLNNPAWRLLCLGAMVCSLAATIATQLSRSRNDDATLTAAQRARCALDALEVTITLGQVNLGDATDRYLQCLEDLPFIDARPAPVTPARRGSRLLAVLRRAKGPVRG